MLVPVVPVVISESTNQIPIHVSTFVTPFMFTYVYIGWLEPFLNQSTSLTESPRMDVEALHGSSARLPSTEVTEKVHSERGKGRRIKVMKMTKTRVASCDQENFWIFQFWWGGRRNCILVLHKHKSRLIWQSTELGLCSSIFHVVCILNFPSLNFKVSDYFLRKSLIGLILECTNSMKETRDCRVLFEYWLKKLTSSFIRAFFVL